MRFLFDGDEWKFFFFVVVMGDKFSVPTNQPSRETPHREKKRTNIYSYILIISFPVIDQFQMSESLNIQELTDNSSIIPISTESTDVQDVTSVSNKDTTTTTTTTTTETTTRVRKSSPSPSANENDKKRLKKNFNQDKSR